MMLAVLLAMADITGFYASNQPEMAAGLELEAGGKFEYSLDYGAVSEYAEGNWVSEGDTIYLTSTKFQGAYKQSAFTREPLKLDGNSLLLHRYDMTIRFNRDDSLPTPPNRNTKL